MNIPTQISRTSDKPEYKKAVNYKNMLVAIEDKVRDLNYFFRAEFASSAMILDKETIIDPNDLDNALLYAKACLDHGRMNGDEPITLKTYCRTRWLSAAKTLRRFNSLRNVVLDISKLPQFSTKISENDLELAEVLLGYLEPFRVFCKIFSNDSVTSKHALPILWEYIKVMNQKKNNDRDSCIDIRSALDKRFEKMKKYLTLYSENDIALVGGFLSMTFVNSNFWCETFKLEGTVNKREHVRNLMAKKFGRLLPLFLI